MSDSENLWGGRFTRKPDKTFVEFNSSFAFDRRLFAADIRASIAYSDSLFHAGVLTRLENERIKNGLQTILKRSDYDKNYFDELPAEDVHSFIEARLVQLIGDAGRKLHTGRSRNVAVERD
jgi:argininosuccinate lyase